MASATFTRKDIVELLASQGINGAQADEALGYIDAWVERGDGCAVYRNEDIGHELMGHLQFVSYGSSKAQIPVPFRPSGGGVPPTRLPDIGSAINWRYVLLGTYTKFDR